MARRPRKDTPGSWHHVTNRGLAKRPLFEARDDVRFFLSRIAREVRRGRLVVHAFCVLTTHFHFLVQSPRGELAEALRRAQNAHSRRFNRLRRRDGALVRGRFFSRPVTDERYRRTLVRYIDQNPVRARIVAHAIDHEFCSAHHYLRGAGPIWLERSWVERAALERTGATCFGPGVYERAFAPPDRCLVDLVERRLATAAEVEPLLDLVGSSATDVRRWMERKARLADGTPMGLPSCSFLALERALDADLRLRREWSVPGEAGPEGGRRVARAGLGRELAGLSWRELAERIDPSVMRLRRRAELHRRLVLEDRSYAERAAAVAREAIAASIGL